MTYYLDGESENENIDEHNSNDGETNPFADIENINNDEDTNTTSHLEYDEKDHENLNSNIVWQTVLHQDSD